MAMVLRYVNDKGQIIERFVGVQYVTDTTSSALKEAIDEFFSSANLSFSKLRRQGYDRASNMRGEFNGLKTKILREQPCAFYVHCFAHQLQLALVAVAKKNIDVNSFFTTANSLVNVVGASCKRRDALRAQYQEELVRAFEEDCLIMGRDLNQETTLKCAGDTRWNSHYAILGITNTLSLALQKKDQDIVSAMSLVATCEENLQFMRDNEFEELVEQASLFCYKHDIIVPTMDEEYVIPGRSRRNAPMKTNYHRYCVEMFIHVIDGQLVELNDRFNEVSTELLTCLACLSPKNNFVAFDKRKLVRLAQFYPYDFSDRDLLMLEDQLGVYVHHMRSSIDFSQLEGISSLAEKMVEKGMNEIFPYVYLLLTLTLVLPVATASVERAFSAMNIIKNPLHNRMGDQWLNDSLIVYIERDVFACIDNETIMQRFQNMKTRQKFQNFYAKPPWPHNPGSATAHCPIHSCSLSGSMHLMITCLHLGITKPKHPTDGTLRYPLPKALLTTISELEPTCFSQASKSHKWRSAMSKEINALLKNNTWSLVPPSPHHNTVGSKWVFRIKRKPDGSIERYKACLVAKGFHQQLGIDYGETFNPIVKPTTIRTILSVAISRGWPLRQLDVKNAFLHGFLQKDVYMIQPPVFIDPDRPNYVYKLHKSLYGLKQAPRAWFHRISSFLITIGFTQIGHYSPSLQRWFCPTPMVRILPSQTEFCELVGCLQYLTLTRPNIAYAVNTVSQFMNASRAPHLVAAKRILQYVKRTVDHGSCI
ncbi:unnamed protein product [Prunus armeniaca]